MFDSNFVARVHSVLVERCVDGIAVPREQICEAVGLPASAAPVISMMLKDGLLPGFEGRVGPRGGVGKIGELPPKKPKVKSERKSFTFPEGFLEKLSEVVKTLCEEAGVDEEGNPRCVTRDQIAKALGEPGSRTEMLVSNALKAGHLRGFDSRPGPKGGIHLVTSVVSEGAADDSQSVESASTEEALATVETAPEPPVEPPPAPKKRRSRAKKAPAETTDAAV